MAGFGLATLYGYLPDIVEAFPVLHRFKHRPMTLRELSHHVRFYSRWASSLHLMTALGG